jgi:hypothetical protein
MGYCSGQILRARRSSCQCGLSIAKALGYTVLAGDRLRLCTIYFGFSAMGFARWSGSSSTILTRLI